MSSQGAETRVVPGGQAGLDAGETSGPQHSPSWGCTSGFGAPHRGSWWESIGCRLTWTSSLSVILVTLSFYCGKKNTAKCTKNVGEF